MADLVQKGLRRWTTSNTEKLTKRPSMRLVQRAHWQVPSTMLACFLGAIALAGAHHGFYLAMNDRPASNNDQAWVMRGGTVLAYLVKVLLVLAASIAYVQILWRHIKNMNMTMMELNDLFSVLENCLLFLNYKVWFRNPLLFVLAATTW